jgi:3-phytase
MIRALAVLASLLVAALLAGPAAFAAPVPEVHAVLQTATQFDDDAGGNADADDPAVWVHPRDRRKTIVAATKKNAGLDVYGLDGATLQSIAPPPAPGPDDAAGRFNNADVVAGLLGKGDGKKASDVVVVTDRGRDQLRIYAIDPAGAASPTPITDVTAADVPFVFSQTQAHFNGQTTAYGLTAIAGPYVAVSQRSRTAVAIVKLIVRRGGAVTYRVVDQISLPASFLLPNGATWTPCEDPGDLPQVEGMVADADRRLLYAGQEDVGIWRIGFSRSGRFAARPQLVDRVREFGVPATFDPATEECVAGADPGFGGKHISADVEGLTIYELPHGQGYLLASSQGDDTFAAYADEGRGRYLGSFHIGDGIVDGVQDSDGAQVVRAALPGFPTGLLVTQDGDDTPAVIGDDGEPRAATSFKYTPWGDVAKALRLRTAPT